MGQRGKAAGQFNYPTYIHIDQEQHIYAVDALNNRIQILDTFGNVISVFGHTESYHGNYSSSKSPFDV